MSKVVSENCTVISEGLGAPRIGQVITWMTPDGPDMGVVVGGDEKDVLAVTAYDKSLKNEPGSKKFRDDDLTATLADTVKSKISGIMFDVHRIPKAMATLTGKLKGKFLKRYSAMADAIAPEKKESVDDLGEILGAVREQFASLVPEETTPDADAPLQEWLAWMDERDSATPLPQHYDKECSVESFNQNIRYFFKVKGKEWEGSDGDKLRRAVAAAYSALHRACGVPASNNKRIPAKDIVRMGAALSAARAR